MKKIIAIEEFAQLLVCIYIFFHLPEHLNVGAFVAAFFVPDIFAVGFLVNNTLGTILYNFSHHKLVALTFVAIGFFAYENILLQAGIIAYAHSSFDRAIGYGLKFFGNPSLTHLGFIGKEKHKNPPDVL